LMSTVISVSGGGVAHSLRVAPAESPDFAAALQYEVAVLGQGREPEWRLSGPLTVSNRLKQPVD
jgi:hypothetical protein